ncbi:hypothetical protein AAFN47_08065 [Hoeflea sp. CAU 1731]
MNKFEWTTLQDRLTVSFRSYQKAQLSGEKINNPNKIAELAADAIKYSSVTNSQKINKKGFHPKYEFRFDDNLHKLGPAEVLFKSLQEHAGNLTPNQAAWLYHSILGSACVIDVPASVFLSAFNYANRLLDVFGDKVYFNEPGKNNQLEKALRIRLLRRDCLSIVEFTKKGKHPLEQAYEQSLRRSADGFLWNGDYSSCVWCLLQEQHVTYDFHASKAANVRYQRAFWAHYYNALLGILPSNKLFESRAAANEGLTENEKAIIEEFENASSISDVEIRNAQIAVTEGNLADTEVSIVHLILPISLPQGRFEQPDCVITSVPVSSPFHDPNFRALHREVMRINGMPLAVLSPTLDPDKTCSLVVLEYSGTFAPDISVSEDGSPYFDKAKAEELQAIHGEEYDPYIADAATRLLSIDDNQEWPDRTALLNAVRDTDSFAVNYFDKAGARGFHFFRPLIKKRIFVAVRDRFLARFSADDNESISAKGARRLSLREPISSHEKLRSYAYDAVQELIAKPCRMDDLWKNIWLDESQFTRVKDEPEVQRYFFHILRPWFEIHGISLTREVYAASGRLDILASATSSGQVMRCAIELKYAHHNKILAGVSSQLPAYMDGLSAEDGIYVALWCKSSKFEEPARYATFTEFENALVKTIPSKYSIQIIVIQAQFRPPPSKLN